MTGIDLLLAVLELPVTDLGKQVELYLYDIEGKSDWAVSVRVVQPPEWSDDVDPDTLH